MEAKETKVELIQRAVKQLMEEERMEKLSSSSDEIRSFVEVDCDEEDNHHLLSRLLLQLETLGSDGKLEQPESAAGLEDLVPDLNAADEVNPMSEAQAKNPDSNEAVDGGGGRMVAAAADGDGGRRDDIIKELKEVKRQNFITHCLVSAMIVLTVAWQLSEVSLILKVKDGLSHPFKSLGSMIAGMVKPPNLSMEENNGKKSPEKLNPFTAASLPAFHVPEIPRVEFPALDLTADEE